MKLFATIFAALFITGVATAQNVGIGTNTPSAKLDVIGNVKITDGTQGAGKVLKSDANGLSKWSTLTGTDILTTTPAYSICPSGVIGRVTTGNVTNSVAVDGNFAYVVNESSNTMQVINISNPQFPTVVGSVTTGLGSNPSSVAISGSYAYVVNSIGSTMKVINISNPAAPGVVGSVAAAGSEGANSIALAGNYAYVVGGFANNLQVIDISNPASPAMVGSVATGAGPYSVAVAGNFAYVVNYIDNTMQVIDISNPAAPAVVGSAATGNGPKSVAVAGNFVYVANAVSNSMQVINVSNPALPSVVSTVATGLDSRAVVVAGNYALVVNYGSNNMQVINISNPASPTAVTYPVIKPLSLAIAGSYIYTTSENTSAFGTVYKLDLYGLFCSANYAIAVNPNTGQTTALPFQWNTTGDDISNANTGKVGIGTLTPTQKLEVAGTTKTTNLQITNGATNGFLLQSDASGNASWVNANTSITETDPKVGTLTSNKIPKWNGSTLADGSVFDDGSNVGIGTITPSNKLSLIGNADISGNLGIGTTTPAQKLDVAGTIKTTSLQMTNGSSNGFVLKSDASGIASWVNANTLAVTETDPKVGILTSNKIPKWNGTTLADGGIFDNGSSVGVGTTSPAAKLHINASSTALRIDAIAGQNAFSIGGTGIVNVDAPNVVGGRFTIKDNGDVGIGTDAPAATLDVNGAIKTKYSGTALISVSIGITAPYQVSIPALPAGWDYSNTVVLLSAADGAAGNIQKVKLTSLTNIDVYYQALQTAPVRFNWIIFKM